jgi:ATP-dependent DNA helicase RecQ
LSTFGIGVEHDRQTWLTVIRQLCSMQLLQVDPLHGSLSLGNSTSPLLKGEVELMLRKDVIPSSGRSSRKKAPTSKLRDLESLPEANRALFDALKVWRKEEAEAQKVPSYVVGADKLLMDLSQYAPQNTDELILISGIGKRKAEQYGEKILELIAQHQPAKASRKDLEKSIQESEAQGTSSAHALKGDTVQCTLDLFKQGLSVESIAEERELAITTIHSHLSKSIELGELSFSDVVDLSEEQEAKIVVALQNKGGEGLKAVFEQLEGKVEYHMIRYVQAKLNL